MNKSINSKSNSKCESCGGNLEVGFLMDYQGQIPVVQKYASSSNTNIVKKTDNTFMSLFSFYPNIRELRQVEAKRCMDCNRLYLFADSINYLNSQNIVQNRTFFFALTSFLFVCSIVILILLFIGVIS